ncbi:hypothetical protein LP7551_01836 [Roseibium album]|nr:hypothetical protein LP7551_01836 [Roseibium album]
MSWLQTKNGAETLTTAKQSNDRPLPTGPDVLEVGQPTEIRVLANGKELNLSWPDGADTSFTAAFLRANSQSAGSKKLRLLGLDVPISNELKIVAVKPIGAYAINIVFSDGYDRGIFPWAYLQQLTASSEIEPANRVLTADDFLKSN